MTDKRIFEYLCEQGAQHPQDKAFGSKVGNSWVYYTTSDMIRMGNRLSAGLLQAGLKPGDKVATVVHQTTPEWVILDFAMLQIGVLNIPMYPTISAREYAYILNESGAVFAVVGDADLYDKVSSAQSGAPALREIFTMFDHPGARRWEALLSPEDPDLTEVERIKAGIRPDDLATIIYTSGTTGNPKGVMLTHRNIVFNVEAMRALIPMEPGDSCLSFLPVSHVFERAVVYAYTAYGASVTFTGTDNLGGETGDLQTIRPYFFTTVPRLLEKVYERIHNKGMELKGLKRWLFFGSMQLTDTWAFDQRPAGWKALEWLVADKLIFSKWRAALGGRIKGIITGASPCSVRIMRTFNAAGIPVREGYGLTEVAPAISFSRFEPHGALLGTVGLVLEGIDIRIEPDADSRPGEGEILVKTPGMMQGYYQQPEKTAEMIRDINGEKWLATGDVGMLQPGFDGRAFLKITDRKKELLKTSGGKYVAPSPIESVLKEHALVDQAMVVGEGLKFVSALIIPSVEGLKDWCSRHGLAFTSLAEMIQNPSVIQRYQMLVDRVNPLFGQFEQVKKFTLLATPWEPVKADGSESELTPTLKLKRRVIMRKFEREVAAMYGA
jgi:long-chain acyl-CoA synthetase